MGEYGVFPAPLGPVLINQLPCLDGCRCSEVNESHLVFIPQGTKLSGSGSIFNSNDKLGINPHGYWTLLTPKEKHNQD